MIFKILLYHPVVTLIFIIQLYILTSQRKPIFPEVIWLKWCIMDKNAILYPSQEGDTF